MGIAPPHGSHAALPIACDALNARTVAVRKYHYVFCAVVARKPLHLLSGAVLVARLPGGVIPPDSVMARPPFGSAQKERIRFALCCAAVILRRFLCQGAGNGLTVRNGKGNVRAVNQSTL